MYLFLIILAFGLINSLEFKDLNPRDQKDDLLYYKKFVDEKILVENIRQIRVNDLNPEELADYINQWEQISNVNFLILKHLGIGHAWYRLDKCEKAIIYHTNAFEKGFDIEHLRAVNVGGIYDTLKTIFPAARDYYFATLIPICEIPCAKCKYGINPTGQWKDLVKIKLTAKGSMK